jgi:hypothetical protein
MHPLTAQWVQDLKRTASTYQSGDCTSKSVALATLLAALGYYSDFRVCNYVPGSGEFSHVFVIASLPDGTQLSLDPSSPDAYPGWYSDCANMADYRYWQAAGLLGQDGQDSVDTSGGDIIDTSALDGTGGDNTSGFVDTSLADNADSILSALQDLAGGTPQPLQDIPLYQDPNTGGVAYYNQDGTTSPVDPTNPLDQAAALEANLFNPANEAGATTNQVNFPDGSVEVQNADGSVVKVNPDNSYTLWKTNGTIQSFDSSGNPVTQPTQTNRQPPSISSAGLPSSGGGGAGAGKPLTPPSSGAATAGTGTSLTSILKSIASAFGIGTQTPTTAINPLTGQRVLVNPVTGQPISSTYSTSGTGISLTSSGLNVGGIGSISMGTILLIAVFFFALKK